jgi:N-glycosylase/DNA lyase
MASVRFNENKSKYLVLARELFTKDGSLKVKEILGAQGDAKSMRAWLIEHVKGMGYKEAGHFLRNVGFGEDIAILDRHILKNLLKYGVIEEIPKSLTPKKYLEIEEKMKNFSISAQIPFDHLDLLWWSEEAGEIFK